MKNSVDKIQTGLRVPQARYEEIKLMADNAGVSVNTVILQLVDLGMQVIQVGVQELRRSDLHSQQDNA